MSILYVSLLIKQIKMEIYVLSTEWTEGIFIVQSADTNVKTKATVELI